MEIETKRQWEVSYYARPASERVSRWDWMTTTDRYLSFIEAEAAALKISADREPSITLRGDDDVALSTYQRRFDLTAVGAEELRQFLINNLKTREPFSEAMLWSWADDVLDSLNADNRARIEIRARDSITGNPVTFELSDDGWVEYFDENLF